MRRLAAALALLAHPAAAQEVPPIRLAPPPAFEAVSPEAFLDVAEGRTLTFVMPGGGLVGIEEFVSRTETRWTRANGDCAIGTVTLEGDQICFAYDDMPERLFCWWPMRRDERLFVRSASGPDGEIQEIVAITDEPVGCTPPLLSRAEGGLDRSPLKAYVKGSGMGGPHDRHRHERPRG